MSTITKERVAEIIHAAGLEHCDYEAVFESIKTGEIVAMARIALASIEAEAVSFDDLRDAVAEVSGGPAMEWSEIYKGHQAVPFINFNSLARIVDKFRTAPPAPVSVPDDGREQFEAWFKFHHGDEHSIATLHRANGGLNYRDPHVDLAWIAWKDSRAAMLQGADGNSPDGWVACSERMPEQFVEVLACTEDGGRYIAALNQRMAWDDGDFFDDIQDVTHWQLLPSPPAK